MRVGLPAWRLLNPRGGVGNTLWQLLDQYRALAPNDEFVVIHDGREADLPTGANLRPRPLRVPWFENNFTWNHLALRFAARREQVDLVHNVSYILPRGLPCPAVVTVHDVSYSRHPEWYGRRTRAFLAEGTRRAVKHALVVTDSRFSADEMVTLYGADPRRIEVVPLAADPRYRPRNPAPVRSKYGLPERFVLYLGGVHERRRFELLLGALAKLGANGAPLVVAGPVAEEALAVGLARAGLTDELDLRLLGYVPDEDLPGLYSAATCFAWPSVYEGFGLPPLEALACGTPTIVADASSLPEVVGDAALRVPPDDLDALSEALGRVLGQPTLRSELAAAGPLQAAKFRWDRTASLMLDLYRRAAEHRP